jgi:hypothetical protein
MDPTGLNGRVNPAPTQTRASVGQGDDACRTRPMRPTPIGGAHASLETLSQLVRQVPASLLLGVGQELHYELEFPVLQGWGHALDEPE